MFGSRRRPKRRVEVELKRPRVFTLLSPFNTLIVMYEVRNADASPFSKKRTNEREGGGQKEKTTNVLLGTPQSNQTTFISNKSL